MEQDRDPVGVLPQALALPAVPGALTVRTQLSEVTLLPGYCCHSRAGGRWWSMCWLRGGQSHVAAL